MMNLGARDIFLFAQWSKYISKKITSDPTSLSIVDCLEILPPVNWCPDCADNDEYKSATEYMVNMLQVMVILLVLVRVVILTLLDLSGICDVAANTVAYY